MKHFLIIPFIVLMMSETKAQTRAFTNYVEREKKLELLSFGYFMDSVSIDTIPRLSSEEVYLLLQSKIDMIASDINKEIDGPYKFMFFKDREERFRIKKFPESQNQPSGLYGLVYSWPNEIYQIAKDTLDFSKSIVVEFGPSEDYYKTLINDPSAADYAMEAAFAYQNDNQPENRIYSSPNDAVTPTFPGGIKALDQFLYNEIIKPLKAQEHRSRTLIYYLTIEKDGTISAINPTLNRGTPESKYGLEILETKMPKWTPAYRYGDAVRSKYVLKVRIKPFYSAQMIAELQGEN